MDAGMLMHVLLIWYMRCTTTRRDQGECACATCRGSRLYDTTMIEGPFRCLLLRLITEGLDKLVVELSGVFLFFLRHVNPIE